MNSSDVTNKILNDAIRRGIESRMTYLGILGDNTPVKITPYYNGQSLVATTAITKEVQRRTHKKHRINKKWAKRYGYKTVPDDRLIIQNGSIIYATPKAVKRLVSAMKGGAEDDS
jgi:predicted exporter